MQVGALLFPCLPIAIPTAPMCVTISASQLYVDSLYDLRTEQDGQAKV